MKIGIVFESGVFYVNEKCGEHLQSKHLGVRSKQKSEIKYILDPFEVLYLFEKRKQVNCIEFEIKSREDFLSKFDISLQEYLVFSDLQLKGYVVKQALKFGATFRIYKKVNKGVESHASHLVFVTSQKKSILPEELFSINRVAHSSKKKILLAYVDYELSVSYLEQSRFI